jgi:hypothetical protein
MATASLVKTSTHTPRDWRQRAGEGSSGTLSGKLGMVLVTLSTSNIPASGSFQRASLMGVSPVFTSTIEFLNLDVLQYDVPLAWVEFHLFRSPRAGTSTLVA